LAKYLKYNTIKCKGFNVPLFYLTQYHGVILTETSGSAVFMGALAAKKAFDRTDNVTLFHRLCDIDLLVFACPV